MAIANARTDSTLSVAVMVWPRHFATWFVTDWQRVFTGML